jgi:hypothetical protein
MLDADHYPEAARFFDDSSLGSKPPKLVVICGGVCAGKTTMRRQQYGTGYVVLDAVEIFLDLCRGDSFDFPGPFTHRLNCIGSAVAKRAVHEQRNLVTELIGDREPILSALLDAFRACGYHVEFVYVRCDMTEAWRRNQNRGEDNISAHYAQEFHERWLLDAAALRAGQPRRGPEVKAAPN